jgi:hypothetical protein
MSNFERSQAINDIRDHIMTHGSRRWRLLRSRYPTVSEPTFWRWVRAVKEEFGCGVRAQPEEGSELQKALVEKTPDPAATARGSAVGGGPLRFAELQDLHHDAALLRGHALTADGRIRDPALFHRSMKLRMAILERAVKLQSLIFENYRAGAFFGSVLREIGEEAPELQRRVTARLTRLDESMT